MITELTLEQAAQIPIDRQKWRQVALSTQRIDHQKAAESILSAYAIAGIPCPKIVFCHSPYAAFSYTIQEKPFWGQPTNLLGERVDNRLTKQLNSQLFSQLTSQLTEELMQELRRMNKPEDQQLLCNLPKMTWDLWKTLGRQLGVEWFEWWQWEYDGPSLIDPMQWASHQGSFLDYCISVLNCSCDQARWQAFQTLVQECGWILPYQKVCLVCERPTDISFDGHRPVYEVGEAVMRYADGFSITGIVAGGSPLKKWQFTIPTTAIWVEFNVSKRQDADKLFSHLRHELNPEQEALLAVYREKWKGLIFKPGKVERQQAIETIRVAYTAIGQAFPTVTFCGNPQSALTNYINNWNEAQYGENLDRRFERLLWSDLENVVENQLSIELHKHLTHELNERLESLHFNSGEFELTRWLAAEFEIVDLGWYVAPAWWACAGAYLDFCITVLNCTHDTEKWQAFQALVQHCGWIFPYTKVCYVCDRPVSFLIPAHEEDDLAEDFYGLLIQFADGFSLSLTPEQAYAASVANHS